MIEESPYWDLIQECRQLHKEQLDWVNFNIFRVNMITMNIAVIMYVMNPVAAINIVIPTYFL